MSKNSNKVTSVIRSGEFEKQLSGAARRKEREAACQLLEERLCSGEFSNGMDLKLVSRAGKRAVYRLKAGGADRVLAVPVHRDGVWHWLLMDFLPDHHYGKAIENFNFSRVDHVMSGVCVSPEEVIAQGGGLPDGAVAPSEDFEVVDLVRYQDQVLALTGGQKNCLSNLMAHVDDDAFVGVVMGPGGSGKTCLVVQFAEELLSSGHEVTILVESELVRAGLEKELKSSTTCSGGVTARVRYGDYADILRQAGVLYQNYYKEWVVRSQSGDELRVMTAFDFERYIQAWLPENVTHKQLLQEFGVMADGLEGYRQRSIFVGKKDLQDQLFKLFQDIQDDLAEKGRCYLPFHALRVEKKSKRWLLVDEAADFNSHQMLNLLILFSRIVVHGDDRQALTNPAVPMDWFWNHVNTNHDNRFGYYLEETLRSAKSAVEAGNALFAARNRLRKRSTDGLRKPVISGSDHSGSVIVQNGKKADTQWWYRQVDTAVICHQDSQDYAKDQLGAVQIGDSVDYKGLGFERVVVINLGRRSADEADRMAGRFFDLQDQSAKTSRHDLTAKDTEFELFINHLYVAIMRSTADVVLLMTENKPKLKKLCHHLASFSRPTAKGVVVEKKAASSAADWRKQLEKLKAAGATDVANRVTAQLKLQQNASSVEGVKETNATPAPVVQHPTKDASHAPTKASSAKRSDCSAGEKKPVLTVERLDPKKEVLRKWVKSLIPGSGFNQNTAKKMVAAAAVIDPAALKGDWLKKIKQVKKKLPPHSGKIPSKVKGRKKPGSAKKKKKVVRKVVSGQAGDKGSLDLEMIDATLEILKPESALMYARFFSGVLDRKYCLEFSCLIVKKYLDIMSEDGWLPLYARNMRVLVWVLIAAAVARTGLTLADMVGCTPNLLFMTERPRDTFLAKIKESPDILAKILDLDDRYRADVLTLGANAGSGLDASAYYLFLNEKKPFPDGNKLNISAAISEWYEADSKSLYQALSHIDLFKPVVDSTLFSLLCLSAAGSRIMMRLLSGMSKAYAACDVFEQLTKGFDGGRYFPQYYAPVFSLARQEQLCEFFDIMVRYYEKSLIEWFSVNKPFSQHVAPTNDLKYPLLMLLMCEPGFIQFLKWTSENSHEMFHSMFEGQVVDLYQTDDTGVNYETVLAYFYARDRKVFVNVMIGLLENKREIFDSLITNEVFTSVCRKNEDADAFTLYHVFIDDEDGVKLLTKIVEHRMSLFEAAVDTGFLNSFFHLPAGSDDPCTTYLFILLKDDAGNQLLHQLYKSSKECFEKVVSAKSLQLASVVKRGLEVVFNNFIPIFNNKIGQQLLAQICREDMALFKRIMPLDCNSSLFGPKFCELMATLLFKAEGGQALCKAIEAGDPDYFAEIKTALGIEQTADSDVQVLPSAVSVFSESGAVPSGGDNLPQPPAPGSNASQST